MGTDRRSMVVSFKTSALADGSKMNTNGSLVGMAAPAQEVSEALPMTEKKKDSARPKAKASKGGANDSSSASDSDGGKNKKRKNAKKGKEKKKKKKKKKKS